jgi:hypothetical protein
MDSQHARLTPQAQSITRTRSSSTRCASTRVQPHDPYSLWSDARGLQTMQEVHRPVRLAGVDAARHPPRLRGNTPPADNGLGAKGLRPAIVRYVQVDGKQVEAPTPERQYGVPGRRRPSARRHLDDVAVKIATPDVA